MKIERRDAFFLSSLLLCVFFIVGVITIISVISKKTWNPESKRIASQIWSHGNPSQSGGSEYQCYGVCYCDDFDDGVSERRTVRLLSRLIYSFIAFSSITAVQYARNKFEEDCSQLECPSHSSTRIAEVEHCEETGISESSEFEELEDGSITLGSESTYKRGLFTKIFPEFERDFTSADIDEKAIRNPSAETMVLQISHAKADKIIEDQEIEFGDEEELEIFDSDGKRMRFLVTTDIITRVGNEILEKPEDEDDAKRMIRSYGRDINNQPETVCGVVVVDLDTGERLEGVDIVRIDFEEIPEEVIEDLVANGHVMKTCGALTIEDPRVRKYIKKIHGEEESVIGLPKKLTRKLVYRLIMKRKEKMKKNENS